MKSFSNKVTAITGAGSGIGRALARALAAEGCHLALSDVDAQPLAETARLCEQHGVHVTHATVDVANRHEVEEWAQATAREHGAINLIINNAGVAHAGLVAESGYSDYDWILDINFKGVLYGTKTFLPYLKEAPEGGHVVNISSIFGLFAQPGMSAYNATKFAVRGFTESLRQELDLAESSVSATCVHPGGIQTNIARTARMDDSMAQLMGEDTGALQAHFETLFRTTADEAAQAILKAVKQDRRRLLIGAEAHAADWMQRLLPAGYQRLVTGALKRKRQRQRAARRT
ncbi:SDR family NAD(P)-dependent oxidoreductase [Halomonadaceae bacterium KBTZ08]